MEPSRRVGGTKQRVVRGGSWAGLRRSVSFGSSMEFFFESERRIQDMRSVISGRNRAFIDGDFNPVTKPMPYVGAEIRGTPFWRVLAGSGVFFALFEP